jgi:nucleotidyltransferase/DNA polymerase involved in DNA repair
MKVSTVPAAAIGMQMCDTRTLRDLQGVGASIEKDLNLLGIETVGQLARHEGLFLYNCLTELKGRQDPCVLDTFNCAVAQARYPNLPREQTNWWWWSRERKRALPPV